MENIKLMVLDMAGTTIQDQHEVEACFAQTCQEINLRVSNEQILALQGYSKVEVFETLWGEKIGTDHPEYTENVAHSYDLFKITLENYYQQANIQPTDGCLEALHYLRSKHIKIALTTGFYREVANIILRKIGWLKGLNQEYANNSGESPIDLSITSDEVPKGRPQPYMIHKAMKYFNIQNAEQVANIGDTPADLLSGNAAAVGLNIGITNGTHSHAQLIGYPHHYLIENLKYLPQLAENANLKKGVL
jgi:phosphonatase-like hydrolase